MIKIYTREVEYNLTVDNNIKLRSMAEIIDSFTGEYEYMRNDYMAHIKVGYQCYTCVESAFQALRCCDYGLCGMFEGLSGKDARNIGADITERGDWDNIKYDMLYKLTYEKFKQHPRLADKLISTGDSEIKDEFLGSILMRVRSELKEHE
jgi:hypothetical protein